MEPWRAEKACENMTRTFDYDLPAEPKHRQAEDGACEKTIKGLQPATTAAEPMRLQIREHMRCPCSSTHQRK